MTDSAATSPAIRVAGDCESQLKVALERLDKTLDAYEKATKALTASQAENASRIALNDLKDQYIAVLKEMNQQLMDLNKNLVKGTVKSKLKKFLETAEKIALVALGVYLGHL